VGDVVRANLAAVASPVSGAFNIGTGVETSVNQLFRSLAKAAGVNRPAAYGPARPGEQLRSVISPARAAKELNWQPEVSLEIGLTETYRFFQQRSAQGN
ncbi:MAG TPA: hypothetical protein VMF50_07250, partial [Candidatus Binataceae bacterium]|nr:hypothetical protein [Candidatus Binataceae bacterium]